jgi:hypothetical protein
MGGRTAKDLGLALPEEGGGIADRILEEKRQKNRAKPPIILLVRFALFSRNIGLSPSLFRGDKFVIIIPQNHEKIKWWLKKCLNKSYIYYHKSFSRPSFVVRWAFCVVRRLDNLWV